MFCASCGTAVGTDQYFCPNCGSKIVAANPNATASGFQKSSKKPILWISILVTLAALVALLFTNTISISARMLVGKWKGEGQTDYSIFEFSENGNYVHSMFENGQVALKIIGRYEINDKRITLCDATNLYFHPSYKIKESLGNNCARGKPDGWIEIISMSDDTFYTTGRGAFVKMK